MTPVDTKPEVSTNEPLGTATTSFSALSVRNVLFATDFSATSEAALPYAAAICRRFGATQHNVHVLSDVSVLMMAGGIDYVSLGTLYDDAQIEAKERLGEISGSLEDIPQRNYVRHGEVWKNLGLLVEQNDIDLIVVGTHGRGGFGKLLLGSVAENILRHAPCPVLTVGPKVSGRAKLRTLESRRRDLAPPEFDLRQILSATNFSKNATRLAQAAVVLAEEFHSRLTLMHVIEDYSRLGTNPAPIEAATRRLRELIPANAAMQHVPETLIEFGQASERILKVASDREADMIVLGARTAAEVGTTHLSWSSAHHVIAQAHCPVLTIRE
jgi:nucleotide-binding universal stress UspA family protein